jgi:hypothetical protein
MSKKYWVLSMVCVCLLRLAPAAQADAAPTIIGIALPQGQLGQGAEVAEPLQQSLLSQLKAQSVAAVPLAASAGGPVEAEALAKHCTHVLYIRLEQKHSMGGMLGKFAPLAGALPFGALSGRGVSGMMTNAALQGAANAAATSAATSVQEQAGSQLTGAAQSGVKRGDTVALDYRLVAVGSTNPVKAETFSNKATGDGQDVVSPLVGQLAGAVVRVAQGTPVAQSTPPGSSSDTRSSNEHSSLLGGLWGHRNASSAKPTAGTAGSGMDCAKLASMPNAPMSLESCQKLQGAQQAYSQSASDPSAARPGDDQMTCDELTAELRQQQYSVPDQSKVAAARATVELQQATYKREQADALKQQAEDQKVIAAATAADTATEAGSLGLVRGHALEAADRARQARQDAHNEKLIKEQQPVAQQQMGQMAAFGADFAEQFKSNPRLAHLMQLADSKHCKGGG